MPSNPWPADGAVALWTAEAYAHGGALVSYFRWRAATVAPDLMHCCILRHDESLNRGKEEIAVLELAGHPNAVDAQVALLHNYENLWAYDEQSSSARGTYWPQTLLFNSALRALDLKVNVVHPDAGLSGYRLVVAPALRLMDERRARHLRAEAQLAHLVFGHRMGHRTPTRPVHEDGQPGPLHGLLGGHAAVVRYGNATTIGAWSRSQMTEVVTGLCAELGIITTPLPDGVWVAHRGGIDTWVNANEESASLPSGSLPAPVAFERRGA